MVNSELLSVVILVLVFNSVESFVDKPEYIFYPYPFNSVIEISAQDAFDQNGLTPDFVPEGPESTASVTYPSGTHDVDLGNQFYYEDTLLPPTVDWDADRGALYTLIMFDPDAATPNFPSQTSPKVHWLIANIPGNDPKAGQPWAPYLHPKPSPGPAHRYTFVIYKQSGSIVNDLSTDVHGSVIRSGFSVVGFTSRHNLWGPVAGNFFFEENTDDPSV